MLFLECSLGGIKYLQRKIENEKDFHLWAHLALLKEQRFYSRNSLPIYIYIYISTYSYSVRSFESKGKGYLSKIRHVCKLACGSFVEIRGWGKTVLSLLSRSSFRVQIKTWKEVNQYHA